MNPKNFPGYGQHFFETGFETEEERTQYYRRMLREAYRNAMWTSRDPHTKVGAVIACGETGVPLVIASNNYFNSNANPTTDDFEKPRKYDVFEHAERHVIYLAAREGIKTEGTTLFAPWSACPDCARAIVMSGIRRVVAHYDCLCRTPPRWLGKVEQGHEILRDGGVELTEFMGEVGECVNTFDGVIWKP